MTNVRAVYFLGMIGSFMLALHLPSSVFYVFCLFFKKDGCMNVKDVNDKKLYMKKPKQTLGGVAQYCG